MTSEKINRLWKFIDFSYTWKNADTSLIDDISSSWFQRRKVLQESSREYEDFIIRLKREHAIETGIVERMYDLKKGITETFIKEGFYQSYISHGDTNVPVPQLLGHLRDHLDAVDFVFDVVKENRPLTIGFIKELHALVTQHQNSAEGRDQFGKKLKIELAKGTFKTQENNPTREDGTIIMYCPPEHVDSEMDNLVGIYNQLVSDKIPPIIIASWFHHAFTTIHPFQDGNGRVARLLASLILIKFGFFPFTVLREEAKVKYFDALEAADLGNPQKLVDYFSEVQKRNIEKALNIKEVTSSSFDEVTTIFSKKLTAWNQQKNKEEKKRLENNRLAVFTVCTNYLDDAKDTLSTKLNGGIKISIKSCSSSDISEQHFYQIVNYANQHDYYFNHSLPRAWITFRIQLSKDRIYQLGITIHHYGYDDSTIAIGAFLEFLEKEEEHKERIDAALPLDIKPHVISIYDDDIALREKNIRAYLENALTLTLAQIASEL
jgi:fido (protein-threonine AMPylation protein)